MDDNYGDRSPVDRRDDYRNGEGGGGARPRSRSPAAATANPNGGRRQRSRSGSRDRRGDRDHGRDRDRDRGGRRDDRDRDRDSYRDSRGGDRYSRDDDRFPGSSTRGGYGGGGYGSRGPPPRGGRGGRGPAPIDPMPRSSNREALAQDAIQKSKKENRVYVGNLSFQVRWNDLKDFASAEIITLPNGMSKGCGVVEYSSPEEARRAITELNEGQLFGRPAFLREDREEEARYGQAAVSGRQSFPGAAYVTGRDGGGPPARGGHGSIPAVFAPPGPRGLYVTGMSPNIGWQDLKDLFRAAGNVQRADINMDHTTGQSKGTGVVVMDSKSEAAAAIAMFNGYEFDGGRLEVREDRFYHINASRGAHGGLPRGGGRGGFGGRGYEDDRGFGGRGGRGGFGGGRAPPAFPSAEGHRREPIPAPPSTQIFVNNLPWSTSNEDLVELFQTTGTVQEAEVLWEGGRSKGTGVVQFATIEEAETAITKFQAYQYGGRPLSLAFNARWKDFTGSSGAAAASMPIDGGAEGDMDGGAPVDNGGEYAQEGDFANGENGNAQQADEQVMEAA